MMCLPDVKLLLYTLVLYVKSTSTFHVDQVCGVELCRRICQQRECCFVSYDENLMRCRPTMKYPIVVDAQSGESATCTFLTRRVETRTRGDKVVSDCLVGYKADSEEAAPTTSDLFKAYYGGDVCLVRFLLTTKGHAIDLEQRDDNGCTVLLRAAFDGNKEMFDVFLNAGASQSAKNHFNQTLLMLAIASAGNTDIIQQILKNPDVDITSADHKGYTALLYSCHLNDSFIFQLIAKAGGNVRFVDFIGRGVLYYACGFGQVEVVKYILTNYKIEEYDSISNDVDKSLREGITTASLDIVDLLVKHGADLTIVDTDKSSMLAVACKSGSAAMVEYVLSKKCVPVDTSSQDGATPFLKAASHGTIEIMEMLVENECNTSALDHNGYNVLHYASEFGNFDNLEYILKQGFIEDINSKTNVGRTALLLVADSNNTDVFDLLVSSGADVSAVDNRNRNSLHLACRGGHIIMVRHILHLLDGKFHNDHNLSVNSRGEEGRTPLFEATISGFIEIIDLLVIHGGDTNATDDHENTILHKAISNGFDNVVEHILRNQYVSIESRGEYGNTPVLTSAISGNMLIFNTLVARDCNMYAVDAFEDNIFHLSCCGGHVPMVKNIYEEWHFNHLELRGWMGRTPVLLAAYYGHQDVVEYLLNRGCDMSAVDNEGNNALHLAIMRAHRELAMYLIKKYVLDNNQRNIDGITPLQMAIKNGYFYIVAKLSRDEEK